MNHLWSIWEIHLDCIGSYLSKDILCNNLLTICVKKWLWLSTINKNRIDIVFEITNIILLYISITTKTRKNLFPHI